MKLELRKFYTGKSFESPKISYDKSSKKRPAWIYVKNLPESALFISTRVDGKIEHYKAYLSPEIPLYLPITYTSNEMRKFYDKFSEIYDKEIGLKNKLAVKFLFNKINIPKNSSLFDIGAGTGLSAEPLVEKGYTNITLLDYSKKMLEIARKKKLLKSMKFIQKDFSKFESNQKYDVLFSIFSFAYSSYFTEKQMPQLWKKAASLLKQSGYIMLLGHDYIPPSELFKRIKSGKFEIIPGLKVNWYIGTKR